MHTASDSHTAICIDWILDRDRAADFDEIVAAAQAYLYRIGVRAQLSYTTVQVSDNKLSMICGVSTDNQGLAAALVRTMCAHIEREHGLQWARAAAQTSP